MERIILIGLSGTGKSEVGRLLADRLGFSLVDTDAEIARRFGMPVADIFARFGEPVFRAAEREVLADCCRPSRVVIATGGGAPVDEANWVAMRPQSLIVQLTADPHEIVERLRAQLAEHPEERRPLLEAGDPVETLRQQLETRRPAYKQADMTVDTAGKRTEEVAARIHERLLDSCWESLLPVASIGVPTRRSDLFVGTGLIDQLGALVRQRWPEARRAWVVSDANVLPIWGPSVSRSLESAELRVNALAVPPGEGSKSPAGFTEVIDGLIGGGIDRRDVVVALGGGVVGDLAGFAASTVLRGVGLVQVPTSLLAMVDSSVGGKTGINHSLGKNLIGTFYQPQLVVADTGVLETLPPRQLTAGMAEVVKHAMIERSATGAGRAELLSRLESLPAKLDPGEMAELVRRNVLIKAAVVRQDEREAGLRRILNYGHTLGHAMEAAGYRYLHGEAVALGLRAAARLALRGGVTSREVVERQEGLLDRCNLPARFEGDLEIVMERLMRDKKAVGGSLTWVLPTAEAGLVEIRRDVPIDQAREVARELGARDGPSGPQRDAVI